MFSFTQFSYLISAGVILGGIYISRNYKDLLFETGCLYLKVETKVTQLKNTIEKRLVKFQNLKNIEFYLDGYKVYKTNIQNIDENDFPLEYDYIIYKQKDENNEEMYRFFENEFELMRELKEKDKIIFNKCPITILNCKLIMENEYEKVMHNITPFKSVYYSGNKLNTKNFIKHFYNIDLWDNYSIKFIDSNIKSVVLENKELILLGDTNYDIIKSTQIVEKETQTEKEEKENSPELLNESSLDPELSPSLNESSLDPELSPSLNESSLDPELLPNVIENDNDWEQPNTDSLDEKRKKWLSSI